MEEGKNGCVKTALNGDSRNQDSVRGSVADLVQVI